MHLGVYSAVSVGLEKVNRVAIVGPIVGCLVNLYPLDSKKSLIETLIATGGFNIDTFKYLSSFDWQGKFCFTDDPYSHADVELDKVQVLKDLVHSLEGAFEISKKQEV